MNRHAVPNATWGYPGKPPNGGSNPRFYDFDDGVTRIVKWHPSRHGQKACYNELVASRLGQLIGAPILRGVVVYVPDEIIPEDHRQIGASAGFHFGLARMEGENFIPIQHYKEIENSSELPFAAVLLAWLDVGDQQGHNQYLQRLVIRRDPEPEKSTKLFRLIDMGQMFGSFSWTDPSVRTVHTQYKLPDHLAAKLPRDKLESAITTLLSVGDGAIEGCFQNCPDEWGISHADQDGGASRATAARNTIKDILRNGNPSLF